MRRVLYLLWLFLVMLLVWFLPFASIPYSRTREGIMERLARWLRRGIDLSPWRWMAVRLERLSRKNLYRQIDEFVKDECEPVWRRIPRIGYVRLGSSRPQTVLEHVQRVARRYQTKAQERGFSEDQILEGTYEILCHEFDEVIAGKDNMRTRLPHRIADREPFVEGLWYGSEWIPSAPGGVSQKWREDYEANRPLVYEFLKKSKWGKRFADRVIVYYDKFHVGTDPVSVFCRDNHCAELVEEGIDEGVAVDHFWREANAVIADPQTRNDVARKYYEYNRNRRPSTGAEKGTGI